MVKTLQKGSVVTPTQQRPTSSRAHLARQALAAVHTNRKPEQCNPEKEAKEAEIETPRVVTDVEATAQTPVSTKLTDSLLSSIAGALAHILDKYEMEEGAKSELRALAKHASTEAKRRAKWLLEPKAQAKVSTMHLAIRQDLQEIFEHFNRQFTKLDNASKELLDNTSRALKEAVETKGATKGIAMEVSKVTKTADKLTSKTGSY